MPPVFLDRELLHFFAMSRDFFLLFLDVSDSFVAMHGLEGVHQCRNLQAAQEAIFSRPCLNSRFQLRSRLAHPETLLRQFICTLCASRHSVVTLKFVFENDPTNSRF